MSGTPLTVRDPESWARITREAAEQTTAELIARTQAPLEFGQRIAWAVTAKVGHATHGLSSVHRVGLPKGLASTAPHAIALAALAAFKNSDPVSPPDDGGTEP